MPPPITCRLCLEYCNDAYCDLYNEGYENEVFELLKRYFSEELLTMDFNRNLKKLCLNCWHYIEDFHKFQETIIVKQNIKINESFKLIEEVLEDNYVADIPIKFEEFSVDEDNAPAEGGGVGDDDEEVEEPENDIKDFIVEEPKANVAYITEIIEQHGPQENPAEFDDLIATWKSNLQCEICNIVVKRFSLLQRHFMQEHPLEEFHIICCDLKLKEYFELKVHIMYHRALNSYKCDICQKSFANRSSTKRHFKNKHNMKVARFIAAVREHHAQEHRHNHQGEMLLDCKYCGEAFTKFGDYQGHLKLHHYNEWQRERNQEARELLPEIRKHLPRNKLGSKARYSKKMKGHNNAAPEPADCTCWICGKLYHSKRYLRAHLNLHEQREGSYACPYCTKKYHLPNSLSYHIRLKHKNREPVSSTSPKPFKCKICHKDYQTKKALREHETKHEGNPSFSCRICSKEYFLSSSLSSHMKKQHGTEKASYECPTCDEIFHSQRSLREHESQHSQPKVYECEFCHKPFQRQSDMYAHMKNNHRYSYSLKLQTERSRNDKITSLDDLVKSLNMEHQQKSIKETTTPHRTQNPVKELKSKDFPCQLCGKIYYTKRGLREHEAKHTGQELYSCRFCAKKFYLKSTMSTHIKKHHAAEKANHNTSEVETVSFYTEEEQQQFAIYSINEPQEDVGIERDMEANQGDEEEINIIPRTDIKQEYPSPSSSQDPLTESPSEIISPRKKRKSPSTDRQNYAFKCSKCNRQYQTKRSLLAHQQVQHEGKKSFSCKYCSKKFGLVTSMYNHLRNLHPEERLGKQKYNAQHQLVPEEERAEDQHYLISDILSDYV
ncbi:zinc finger protein 28-like [Musca vetustissima]|uniref:zinc finger protein 28-like n=1 Tax=Musca vetustissima TaxID=27455 RepID=UPI002AB6F093|nr:zinc finger protein 28-like [Musca vetustissima]